MKKIIYISLIAIIAFSVGCKRGKTKDDTVLKPQKDTSIYPGYEEFYSNESDMDSDSVAVTQNTATPNDKIMVEDTVGNIQPATPTEVSNSKSFYIIVGSFKKQTNAKKKLNSFKKKGYTAEILPKFGEYNRVSAASFNSEASARSELKSLRKKFHDRTFWLLIR